MKNYRFTTADGKSVDFYDVPVNVTDYVYLDGYSTAIISIDYDKLCKGMNVDDERIIMESVDQDEIDEYGDFIL